MSKVLSGPGEILCIKSLLGKPNMLFTGVDVLQKLVTVFCLLDDKGAIDIPEPQPRCFGGLVDNLGLKLFHEQAGTGLHLGTRCLSLHNHWCYLWYVSKLVSVVVFHRPQEAMLFVMMKAYLCLNIFLIFRTLEYLVLLIHPTLILHKCFYVLT